MTSLDIKQLGGQIFFITRMGSEMGIKNNFFAKILLSGHNFWTRNARWQLKGSKDSFYSLVSTKNLSQKLALAVSAQALVTSAKKA